MSSSKNICRNLDIIPEFNRKDFLESYIAKHKALGYRQRKYKKILTTKLKTRNETILESNYLSAIDKLRLEKNELRAQIWVAKGATHQKDSRLCLENIRCHVNCQEHLGSDIRKLKTDINNLERGISHVDKQIYELNRRTVPEAQHHVHVARLRKKLSILENQLEVGIRRECSFTAANGELREELVQILHFRSFFNDTYSKLVQKLNSDKKYLIDLIEYAVSTFESCTDIYEKINNLVKRESKQREMEKIETQGLIRRVTAETQAIEFLEIKGKMHKLKGLEPKEYRRRQNFRRKHKKKIKIYNDILNKILTYTKSENFDQVIEKFQQQESLYYSYFNYANEMSYHMTLLNNSVNRLYTGIDSLKHRNYDTEQDQFNHIAHLEYRLKEKRAKNDKLQKRSDANNERLDQLLSNIEKLFATALCDPMPLMELIGDYSRVNLHNVRRILKSLENRVNEIIATVFITERQDGPKPLNAYTVKQIDKFVEWPTELDDIVLTQQCPECAEGEAFNMDETGDGGFIIRTVDEIKKRLYEKVTQPEMQYRLHSISHCRLPRSRILAAKRHL